MKIIRGIDCSCDEEYICKYHFKRIVIKGAIIGIIVTCFLFYITYKLGTQP